MDINNVGAIKSVTGRTRIHELVHEKENTNVCVVTNDMFSFCTYSVLQTEMTTNTMCSVLHWRLAVCNAIIFYYSNFLLKRHYFVYIMPTVSSCNRCYLQSLVFAVKLYIRTQN